MMDRLPADPRKAGLQIESKDQADARPHRGDRVAVILAVQTRSFVVDTPRVDGGQGPD